MRLAIIALLSVMLLLITACGSPPAGEPEAPATELETGLDELETLDEELDFSELDGLEEELDFGQV